MSHEIDLHNIEFHPVAEIFPLMKAEEAAALAEDIKANGLRVSIWTFKGKIIDGRNRYRACRAVGIDPRFREWMGDERELAAFVVSLNLKRRHLNESQRAMVARKLSAPRKVEATIVHSLSQTTAAALLNVSQKSIQRAKKLVSAGVPELIEKVEKGEIAVSAAATLAALPAHRQKSIIKKGRNKTRKIISTIRERSLKAATKGGRTCPVCSPVRKQTDEVFLAAVHFLGKQFPAYDRFLTDIALELAEKEVSDETRGNYERILAAIRRGASEHTDCRKATGIDADHFDIAITQMLDYGTIECFYQGGKTDAARGARKRIYVEVIRDDDSSNELTYEADGDEDGDEWDADFF